MSERVDLSRFPNADKDTAISTAVQILLSFIPGGAGVASALVSALMPELNADRVAWLEYMGTGLLSTKERLDVHERRLNALDLDVLVQRPEFRSAIIRTTDIAVRDPLRRKWQMLRNAVYSVATNTLPDDVLQSIFLDNIRDLTVLHLTFLACIADPLGWAKKRNYPVNVGLQEVDARKVFEGACRAELQPPALLAVLLQDLYSRGLAANDVNPDAFLSPQPEAHRPHITELGELFLEFIASPRNTEDALGERSSELTD